MSLEDVGPLSPQPPVVLKISVEPAAVKLSSSSDCVFGLNAPYPLSSTSVLGVLVADERSAGISPDVEDGSSTPSAPVE
jgi:hypothetical protein